jgi:predicted phage-related endonuclease
MNRLAKETPFFTLEEGMESQVWTSSYGERRSFIGGSDARIIMGDDEAAMLRLWHEKRGEAEPKDLSGDLRSKSGAVSFDLLDGEGSHAAVQ